MGSQNLVIFILIATITTQATWVRAEGSVDYVVGDEKGWAENVDYEAWANGKDFYMGDRLVFNFTYGTHNVIKVDEVYLKKCEVPALQNEIHNEANAVVTLAQMGGVGFISGVGNDCQNGLKLFLKDVKCPHTRPKALQSGRKLQVPTSF